MKRHSREEIIAYETNKLHDGDPNAQAKFVGKAIDILNKAWDKDFAKEKFEIACEVLLQTGKCSHGQCDTCAVNEAYLNACTEIDAGLRKRPEKDKQYKKNFRVPGYWVSVYADKNGKVTTVMRPFIKKDKVDIQ